MDNYEKQNKTLGKWLFRLDEILKEMDDYPSSFTAFFTNNIRIDLMNDLEILRDKINESIDTTLLLNTVNIHYETKIQSLDKRLSIIEKIVGKFDLEKLNREPLDFYLKKKDVENTY